MPQALPATTVPASAMSGDEVVLDTSVEDERLILPNRRLCVAGLTSTAFARLELDI